MVNNTEKIIIVGKIVGVYGVKGWLKVVSYTEPVTNILHYKPWQISRDGQWQKLEIAAGRSHGKGIVIQIANYTDRDLVRVFIGADIGIYRSQLPALAANNYYWSDLEGMQVVNLAGEALGMVDHVFATGSNDVLVVQGEKKHLIPFLLPQVIHEVDVANNIIRVDWDVDF